MVAAPVDVSTISKLFTEHGLAVGLVALAVFALFLSGACTAWAGWRITTWLGKQIIIPIRNAILQHVGKINEAIATFAENYVRQTALLERMDERLSYVDDRLITLENGMHKVGCPVIQQVASAGVSPANGAKVQEVSSKKDGV